MKHSKVNSPRFQCFVLIMLALAPTEFLKASPPAQSETSKTKISPDQKNSDGRLVNKKSKLPSPPTKADINRQDAKANVARIEQRLDQLQKDLKAAKKAEKPAEEEDPRPLPDGSPVPRAILVAPPEADEARNPLPPGATTEPPPVTPLGPARDPQVPAPKETTRVMSHTPHAVPVSQPPATSPVAEKANMPGFVISPFPPRKLIDATGMSAGAVVKDPQTGEIFRLPKNLVEVQVIAGPR